MPTAWPSYARTEYAADKSLRESRCKALPNFQQVVAFNTPFTFYVLKGAGTASGVFVTLATWDMAIPYVLRAGNLRAYFTIESDAGTTGEWKLTASGTGGGTATRSIGAATPATLDGPVSIALPDAATSTITLEARVTGGAGKVYTYNLGDLVAWVED